MVCPCQSRPARGCTHINLSAAVQTVADECQGNKRLNGSKVLLHRLAAADRITQPVAREKDVRTMIAWAVSGRGAPTAFPRGVAWLAWCLVRQVLVQGASEALCFGYRVAKMVYPQKKSGSNNIFVSKI